MMKILTKQILFIALTLGTTNAYSTTVTNETYRPPANSTNPAMVDNIANSNATGQARSASSSASIAMIGAAALGTVMTVRCLSSQGTDGLACGIMAIIPSVISAMGSAKGGADNVAGQYNPNFANGGVDGTTTGPGSTDANGNPLNPLNQLGPPANGNARNLDTLKSLSADQLSQLNKIKAGIASSGIVVDSTAGTIKFPNGKTLPINATAADYKAAGFDPATVDQTAGLMQKINDDTAAKLARSGDSSSVPTLTFGGGGGGRGSGAGGGASGVGSDSSANLNAMMGNGRKPTAVEKQGVAGLSRKLGNESIGVQGDNIFEMVNRRYRAQDKQNAFLRDK